MDKIYGWHFTGNTLRDGTPLPRRGVWLRHSGPIVICRAGLHYSEHPFDALRYAPGPILHRVEVRDVVETQRDKGVARERRIVSSMDATDMLRYFARQQVLSVIHLWDAPDIVLDYLMTGDEHSRDAAWGAARDAAWGAARDDARDDFADLVAECGPWE